MKFRITLLSAVFLSSLLIVPVITAEHHAAEVDGTYSVHYKGGGFGFDCLDLLGEIKCPGGHRFDYPFNPGPENVTIMIWNVLADSNRRRVAGFWAPYPRFAQKHPAEIPAENHSYPDQYFCTRTTLDIDHINATANLTSDDDNITDLDVSAVYNPAPCPSIATANDTFYPTTENIRIIIYYR